MNKYAFGIILPSTEYNHYQIILMYKLFAPQYKPVYETLIDIARANQKLQNNNKFNFLVGSKKFVFIDDSIFNTLHPDLQESFNSIKHQLTDLERLAYITKHLYNLFTSLSSWELMRINMHSNFVQAILDLGIQEPKAKAINHDLDQRMVSNASFYIEEVNYAIAFNDLLR